METCQHISQHLTPELPFSFHQMMCYGGLPDLSIRYNKMVGEVGRTLVLVGRAGYGKSATGNSILGRNAFKSKNSAGAVTKACELQRAVLEDGQILDVIDTPPGLVDISEIVNMAKGGIHAVVVVLSARYCFLKGDEAALVRLRELFGSDYMILVFTGGDVLQECDETLEGFLGPNCPEPLKDTLAMCGSRKVLFDNRTKDPLKKADQLRQLVSLVNVVVENNGGKPYTIDK